jgi:hypothetical protein
MMKLLVAAVATIGIAGAVPAHADTPTQASAESAVRTIYIQGRVYSHRSASLPVHYLGLLLYSRPRAYRRYRAYPRRQPGPRRSIRGHLGHRSATPAGGAEGGPMGR